MASSNNDIFLMQVPFVSACNRLCCNPFEVEAKREREKFLVSSGIHSIIIIIMHEVHESHIFNVREISEEILHTFIHNS